MRSQRARVLLGVAVTLALLGGCGERATGDRSGVWDETLEVHGSLRALMHEGVTGSQVGLDTLLPDPTFYAVGALADLAGEVTIVGGRTFLSFPEGDTTRALEVGASAVDHGAALLVGGRVPSWVAVSTERAIGFDELDEAIPRLAAQGGWSADDRFPFLVEGAVAALRWHVIDGRRLPVGESSHRDHLAASVSTGPLDLDATLIGFYSPRDRGVFTHADSRTHVHCVVREPSGSGHVDHMTLPAGTTVRFPRRGGAR